MTGRLYADDTIFDRLRGVADSGYATSPYIGPLSGLSFDSGYGDLERQQLRLRPGQARGGDAGRVAARRRRRDPAEVALRRDPGRRHDDRRRPLADA